MLPAECSLILLLPTFVPSLINYVLFNCILKGTLVSKPCSSGISSGHCPRCHLAVIILLGIADALLLLNAQLEKQTKV